MKTSSNWDKKNKIHQPLKPIHQDPHEPTYPPPGQPPYPEVEPYEIPEEDPYVMPPIEIPMGKASLRPFDTSTGSVHRFAHRPLSSGTEVEEELMIFI